METAVRADSAKATPSEMLAVAGVVAILMVMIVPLPAVLLDFLLALNITLAITVLLIAMNTSRPLDFAVFPSLLLVTTLFRLSLNVASTRLILLHGDEGPAAAGKVIKSFGSFVVGGDYTVGMIVFIILVIINFVVITKGATRIAEVAARFTLDAMPGKQMSIDADLNAGLIDESEAKHRRKTVTMESEFYGAMDGAAKFVRGDAIAGIIITLVNILAGFFIGVFQNKMTLMDAAQNYTLLTVGDGLVSQIPALTISTAAGIVVSRSASEDSMGKDFSRQFLKYPKAIYLSSVIVFFFGLIPGLPHVPFLLLSAVIGGGLFWLRRRRAADATVDVEKQPAQTQEAGPEPVEHLLAVDALEIEVGYGLIPLVDREQGGEFLDRVRSLRRQFAVEMGVVIPPVHIRDNLQLRASEYQILLKGVKTAGSELMVNHFMALDPGGGTDKIEGIATREPAFNLPAVWIPELQIEAAKMAGYTVVDNVTVMATHLTEVLRNHAWELLGRQDVQNLLDNLSQYSPKAVEELVPNLLPLGVVQKVLQNLVRERISIRDLLTIVETLADYAPMSRDPELLTEYVRHKIARSFISPYVDDNGMLKLVTMAPDVEDFLQKCIKKTEHGAYLAVDPKTADRIVSSIKVEAEKAMARDLQPILLTSPALRRHIKKMVDYLVPSLMVLSKSELLSDYGIQSIGKVGFNHAGS